MIALGVIAGILLFIILIASWDNKYHRKRKGGQNSSVGNIKTLSKLHNENGFEVATNIQVTLPGVKTSTEDEVFEALAQFNNIQITEGYIYYIWNNRKDANKNVIEVTREFWEKQCAEIPLDDFVFGHEYERIPTHPSFLSEIRICWDDPECDSSRKIFVEHCGGQWAAAATPSVNIMIITTLGDDGRWMLADEFKIEKIKERDFLKLIRKKAFEFMLNIK